MGRQFINQLLTAQMGSITKKLSEKEIENALIEKFHSVWPKLLLDILNDNSLKDLPEVLKRVEIVINEKLLQGKQKRGMACVNFYHHLVKKMDNTEEDLVYIIGWCIEIWQAGALIVDDIMDSFETRRGQKCRYKVEGVGLIAVNDVFILQNLMYFIIYKYFSTKNYFHKLLSLTHDIGFKTVFGRQSFDTRTSIKIDIDECTIEKYKRIVKYKTSYKFYHPYACAMAMAGITDDKLYSLVEEVSMEIGFLFQVQDDYLDCYGNIDITGKIGKDINNGKCTWLLVKALELASEEQIATIKKYYGTQTDVDTKIIKNIYKTIEIQKYFHTFENETYRQVNKLIKKLPSSIPGAPFITILYKIYKRNK